MKVALTNFSGNVGKTTIARHLLAPRIPEADIISIETANRDGKEETIIEGAEFGALQEELIFADAAIVDIGGSNLEAVFRVMEQYRGSHEDFDYFLVPTVPDLKQQQDTVTTIEALARFGVPAKKIRVLFNMVEPGKSPAKMFPGIFNYHADQKRFTLRDSAVMHTHPVYGLLRGMNRSLREILDDPTDWKAQGIAARKAGDDEKLAQATAMVSVKRLAGSVVEEHDALFSTLFK